MLSKISSMLDAIADSLEKKGFIKEAYEIDKITDEFDKVAKQLIEISRSKVTELVKKQDWEGLQNYLYSCITRMPGWEAKTQTPEFSKIKEEYRQITNKSDTSNPAWSQWNIKKDVPKTGLNFKLYYTPSDESIRPLVLSLGDLKNRFVSVAAKYNMNLDFKIPSSATAYYGSNDRLVVHFSNRDAKEALDQTVKGWAASNKIQLGGRTHNFGQDVGKDSYGIRIAKQIVQEAQKHYSTKKYTDEQIVEWILKYFPKMLKDIQ